MTFGGKTAVLGFRVFQQNRPVSDGRPGQLLTRTGLSRTSVRHLRELDHALLFASGPPTSARPRVSGGNIVRDETRSRRPATPDRVLEQSAASRRPRT